MGGSGERLQTRDEGSEMAKGLINMIRAPRNERAGWVMLLAIFN